MTRVTIRRSPAKAGVLERAAPHAPAPASIRCCAAAWTPAFAGERGTQRLRTRVALLRSLQCYARAQARSNAAFAAFRGDAMKQMNVFPMIAMLVIVVLLIVWLL